MYTPFLVIFFQFCKRNCEISSEIERCYQILTDYRIKDITAEI